MKRQPNKIDLNLWIAIVNLILDNPRISQNRIAEILHIRHETVSHYVLGLEKQGLISKKGRTRTVNKRQAQGQLKLLTPAIELEVKLLRIVLARSATEEDP